VAIIEASAPFSGITDAHAPDRRCIAPDAARTEVLTSRRLSSRQRLRLEHFHTARNRFGIPFNGRA